MSDADTGASLAEWLTAVGTLLAVAVAVGFQAWLAYTANRRRPSLSLEFDSHRYQEEVNPAGGSVPYLRLAVTNAPGKHAARDVEVLVKRVDQLGDGGVRRWLVNPALAWPNSLDPLPRMTIPAGTTRYVDVGCWIQLTPLTLKLAVQPEPNSNRHLLLPGSYEIELAVTARNADATTWVCLISFGESIQQGLAIPANPTASVQRV